MTSNSVIQTLRAIPVLHKAVWRCRKTYYRLQRNLLVHKSIEPVSSEVSAAILNRRPFAAGKMGSVEVRGLAAYLKREQARKSGLPPAAYPKYTANTLFVNAGVFPADPDSLDQFCSVYLDAVRQFDALGAWDVEGEATVLSSYGQNASLFRVSELEPFFSPQPWSASLAGKRILIVSPFVSTVREQYLKRDSLWANPEVLPAFELLTVRAPLSAGISAPAHESWMAALESMKAQVDSCEYDVLLVGAGAFSLPLAAHAKSQGKVGIHLGGGLQLLFGILGKRWENQEQIKAVINDSWTRPHGEERPTTVQKVENACYW